MPFPKPAFCSIRFFVREACRCVAHNQRRLTKANSHTTDCLTMAPRDRVFLDDNSESTPIYFTERKSQQEEDETIGNQRRRPTKVTFHLVHVREFERVVGDHPEVKVGPPISLGWNFVQRSPVMLDSYESSTDHRNSSRLNRLTSIARQNMLLEYGFTHDDFRIAERSVKTIQAQRSDAKTNDDRTKLQRVGRSIRKNLFRTLTATAKGLAPPMVLSMS